MEINNLNGPGAYTNIPANTPPADNTAPVDNTTPERQNLETRETVEGNTSSNQDAFDVSITREAQEKLAADNAAGENATPPAPPENQDSQEEAPPHETSRIVNIVA